MGIDNLIVLSQHDIDKFLDPVTGFDTWCKVLIELERVNLRGMSGCVVRGELRAMCYLIQATKTASVLEIGNRSGHSTLGLALSLRFCTGVDRRMVSVDIADWNNKQNFRRKFKHTSTPFCSLKKTNCDYFVRFIVGDSAVVLPKLKEKFDFVFIDGSHKTKRVYLDIVNSFNILNPDGMIVLHDYYPDLKPLWAYKPRVTRGPFDAMELVKKKYTNVIAFTLNDLPWVNWEPSHKTTLAIVARKKKKGV